VSIPFFPCAQMHNSLRFLVVSLILAAHSAGAQQGHAPVSVLPKAIAARGLPVRADTLDGYIDDRGKRQFFGYYIHALSKGTIDGRAVYFVTMDYRGSGFQSDTIALDAATLTPLWRRFHAREDTLAVTYTGRTATGIAHQNRNGSVTRKKLAHQLSDSAFASGMLRWITAILPLAEGYAFSLTTYSEWGDAEATSAIAVTGSAMVKAGNRQVDTWVLKLPGGGERWIEKGTGRMVQERDPRGLGDKDGVKVLR
jgi:hypothetical protein